MAVVTANFVKRGKIGNEKVKATIRYIQHRPGKDGAKLTRTLYGNDGVMGRQQAYRMIDEAERGTYFYRIAISPDPVREDTHKDLHLRDITEQTMMHLEERFHQSIFFVATEHNDHAPHRHVHIVAAVKGRLTPQDLQSLRETATQAALLQRKERDLAREHQQGREEEEEQEWERS